ncbi:hypothetical protein [Rhodococcus sp. IEGM 1379]|uniref:hypothetical protein n=1 Tax=Rhodococcus sp. IEGM 1379 TaxID=3047086 RepID=UPI0024B72B05|nr:hypothetical protein [Rhodococcus sp. IEGM 1379]MDI9919237.1 hypothetical protein [Rhodococcus sp. IEGM 1379]
MAMRPYQLRAHRHCYVWNRLGQLGDMLASRHPVALRALGAHDVDGRGEVDIAVFLVERDLDS